MTPEAPIHVLLVSYPAQGHVNPLLRLGQHLAAKGCFVTFSSSKNNGRRCSYTLTNIQTSPTPIANGFLTFDFFDDSFGDSDYLTKLSFPEYISHLKLIGMQVISQMVKKHAEAKRSVSCIIYNPFVWWVHDVAVEHDIPSALYWIHSAATFTACYYCFKNLSPFPTDSEPYTDVHLPHIVLKHYEIPEFLHPFSPILFLKTLLMQLFENLPKTFCVLMDTFEALEHEDLNYLSQFHLIRPIGPLFKNQPAVNYNNSNNGGDVLKVNDCIEWLNSRPVSSVVYVSLGTIVSLPVEQIGELAHGLLNSQVWFLWVLRASEKEEALKANVMPEGFFESERGKVVQWSPQVEVLTHPSVACYFSHCGWNSSIESLASGVPMLTFSQFSDQVTNAKLVVDVFRVGIRVAYNQFEKKLISKDEIKRLLLEATVGAKAEELKKNAIKWKTAAEAARANGGPSDRNLDAFVRDIKNLIHIKMTQ